MKKLWFRVLAVFACLLFVAAIAGVSFFKLAEAKIASRLRPPRLAPLSLRGEDLSFYTLDGQSQHRLAKKGKVVFLDLWGTWCLQCVAEMPTVQRLYEHYRNDPQVGFPSCHALTHQPQCNDMHAEIAWIFRFTSQGTRTSPTRWT